MTMVIVLTTLMLPISLYLLIKNPFNLANVVSVLSWLFAILPAIYFASTRIIPSYSWRNMTFVGGPLSNGTTIESGLIELTLITTTFTLGCLAASFFRFRNPNAALEPRATSPATTMIMIGLWISSVFYILILNGGRIDLVLLPVKDVAEELGYFKMIFMIMPAVLFAKFHWENGRIDKRALFWLAITLYVAFSRPQRRDLVTVVMFFIAFIPLMRSSIRDQARQAAAGVTQALRNRLIALGAMFTALSLVPILWYSRVYFTAAAAGEDLDPTRIRSFSELLLGSPATGYPTFLLVERHVAAQGADPFHTITYLSSIFIPRSLWSGKPTDIDSLLEAKYRLIENPSIFWFGELYYSFGIFSIPIAFLLGFALYAIARSAATSSSLLFRSYAAVMFMHSPTLFKNGISHFVINSMVIAIFLAIAWYFPAPPHGKRFSADRHHPRRRASSLHDAALAANSGGAPKA